MSNIKYQIKKINWKLVIIGNLILVFILVQGASAQSVSLGIFPPIMQIDTTPPAEVKSKFILQNESNQSLDLEIQFKAFKAASSNDGQVEILENFESFPDPFLLNRVKIKDKEVSIKSLTLSPKQKKELSFEITIPPNEAKGDYYFTVFFTTKPQTNISSNSTLASAGIAMNVLLTVGPKGEVKGFIEKFSAPLFVDRGPVAFTILAQNQSDHFVSAQGSIVIENVFGQKVGKVDLLPVNILSGSKRLIPDNKEKDLKLAIWPEKFLIGPYKATLTLGFSETEEKLKRSITFFAFPATYSIAILIVLGVITLIIMRVRKKID